MPSQDPKTKVEKVEAVIALLASQKSGVTLNEIAAKLKVNLGEAGVLVAEARRRGIKVRFDVEDGRYRT